MKAGRLASHISRSRDPGTKIEAELLVNVAGYIFSHRVTGDMQFRWSQPDTGDDS